MASLKRGLSDFKSLIQNIVSKKIDFDSKFLEGEFDFKRQEREYYSQELNSGLRKLKMLLFESFVASGSKDKEALSKVADKIKELEEKVYQRELQEAITVIDSVYKIAPSIRISESKSKIEEFSLPKVPVEIHDEVKSSFDELIKCYEQKCYRSSLILCGRILEIVLHRKYFEITSKDLLEKAPGIGLGNLLFRLKEKGFSDPGLSNQIHLINQLRIASVHKKKETFKPSKAQCKASILYTLDILKKIFK